jgi:sporulation protein YlmC with PRC-barrel domain
MEEGSGMDEGLPIAYEVLEKGVLVYASDGEQVGTVDHVVAAPEQDIFHGIVIKTGIGQRLVLAEQIASLHERGVDLSIDASTISSLPHPHGAAPAWRDAEPGVKPKPWRKWIDVALGKSPLDSSWRKDD